jgi:RNA-directed DNA polymerase
MEEMGVGQPTIVTERPPTDWNAVNWRVVRGWANYYRTVASTEVFSAMDTWMNKREWRYTKRTHKDKSSAWRKARYFGKFVLKREDHSTFGDKSTGQYIWKFSWTHIRRHVLVTGTASPDDPELKDYWESRIKAKAKGLPVRMQRLARRQSHRCPRCGEDLDNDELLETNHINGDRSDNRDSNLEILHLYCHQQFTAEQRKSRKAKGVKQGAP